MPNLIHGNHKHLTLEDRLFIEKFLNEHKSFREIDGYLCKDLSIISKEIWNYSTVNTWNHRSFNNPYNFLYINFRILFCILQEIFLYTAINWQ